MALNITRQQSEVRVGSTSWIDEMAVFAFVSAKSILNLYLQLPPNKEVGVHNMQWVQMGFATLVACRHTTAVDKPNQVASFLHTLAKLQSRFEASSTSNIDMNGARDVSFDFKNRVIRIRN
jgi:hypothetical protein